jgi:hypothetical protein
VIARFRIAVGALLLAARVHAQEPAAQRPVHVPPEMDTVAVDSAEARPAPPSCWRARRRPPCEGFFLTELGVHVPIATTGHRDPAGPSGAMKDFPTRVTWTFGLMATTGPHSHGGAFSITTEEGAAINLVEYRYRRWLTSTSTIDAGLGFKTNAIWQPGEGFVPARGGTVMLGFTPSHWVGASIRADVVRARGATHRGVLAGLHSTRASEWLARVIVVEVFRALLGAIGIELDDDVD